MQQTIHIISTNQVDTYKTYKLIATGSSALPTVTKCTSWSYAFPAYSNKYSSIRKMTKCTEVWRNILLAPILYHLFFFTNISYFSSCVFLPVEKAKMILFLPWSWGTFSIAVIAPFLPFFLIYFLLLFNSVQLNSIQKWEHSPKQQPSCSEKHSGGATWYYFSHVATWVETHTSSRKAGEYIPIPMVQPL